MNSTGRNAALLAVAIGVIGAFAARIGRRRATQVVDGLERKLCDAQPVAIARADLPEAVLALATRLGVRADVPSVCVAFGQRGTMTLKKGAAAQPFVARQTVSTASAAFVWDARIGTRGMTWVVDSLVAGRGLLEARLFGALRVAHAAGTDAIDQGEALRYLAELPLNPDAILFNRDLEWSVQGDGAIAVACGTGGAHAQIVFALDAEGLITGASAVSRVWRDWSSLPLARAVLALRARR